MPPVHTDATDLDHVALAAERHRDLWPRLIGDLGGRWAGAGDSPGFRFAQVTFDNGMRVEVLEPLRVEENDFLRRFLDRSGPGPHHLTFKVPDLVASLAALEEAGWSAINVDLSDPGWQEAFLHPKTSHGIVVQLAQSDEEPDDDDGPIDLPDPRVDRPATLARVVHLVADLDRATKLFGDLLGGTPTSGGTGEVGNHRHVELAWPGPGRLRLVQPAAAGPLAAWLGDRAGRLHHLEFAIDDPEQVPTARPRGDGTYEVAPDDACGTRLVVTGRE
jgi:catechol 2,3-dioxygenase-like lactoylglutathione lyase family enzyme